MFRKGIRRRGRWTFAACAALVVLSATAPVALDPHQAGWRPLGVRPVQGADPVPEVVWQRGQLGPCGHQGGARPAVYGQRSHLRLVFDTFEYVEHAPCAERVPQPAVGILPVFPGLDAAEEAQDSKGGHVRADEHVRGEETSEGKREGERGSGVSADEDLSVREPAAHLASGPQYPRVFRAPGDRTTADLPEPGSGRVRRAVRTAAGAPRPTTPWRGAGGGSGGADRSGETAGAPTRGSHDSRPPSRDGSPSAAARSHGDSSGTRPVRPVYRVPMAPPLSPGRSPGYPWVGQPPSWGQATATATSTATAWSGPVAPR
ncbi:hypothetical protein ACIQ9Q_38125 [Streptomyces sp. NPDC094438]|uniref:hypothetical protein n=1 Tax=Streptomyces sp. NPDC094438 TaxID=3366061 RepID=UPI0038072A77